MRMSAKKETLTKQKYERKYSEEEPHPPTDVPAEPPPKATRVSKVQRKGGINSSYRSCTQSHNMGAKVVEES